MVKHTQTIRRQIAENFLNVFDNFVGLALKELMIIRVITEHYEKRVKKISIKMKRLRNLAT